jgi:hypothetical protein
MVKGSVLKVIRSGPHGINVSHAAEFNEALVTFLKSSMREPTLRT